MDARFQLTDGPFEFMDDDFDGPNLAQILDIAPTISALLGIAFPSGATGRPIGEVLE